MPLYDFTCSEGDRSELLRPVGTTVVGCPTCGRPAKRTYGYSVAIGHPRVDERGMFRRFQEASAELADRGGSAQDLWAGAKATAQGMIQAGENPVRRSY